MAKSTKAGSVKWTGKNLAEVKALYRKVKHYPEKPGDKPYYRDWTQHPDNLHVTSQEGHTVIAEIGDSVVLKDGKVSVQKAAKPRAPRALRPVPSVPGGKVHHVTAAGRGPVSPLDGPEEEGNDAAD